MVSERDLFGVNHDFMELIKEDTETLVSSYCNHYNYPRPHLVFHNDVMVCEKFKAYAGEENGTKIIGITITMALALRRYFLYALAHRSINEIGDKPPLVKDPKSLFGHANVHLSLNRNQYGMAEDLARISLMYIAAHELSHLKLGHVTYLKGSPSTSALDHRAMEVAADRCAADILTSYAIMLERDHAFNWQAALSLWLAAVGSTFRIEWGVDDWSEKLHGAKHPPAQYRGSVSAVQILLRFKELKNLSDRFVLETYTFMIKEIERFHEDVTGVIQHKLHGVQFLKLLRQQKTYTQSLLERHRTLFPDAEC